jgi:hypothetical protein
MRNLVERKRRRETHSSHLTTLPTLLAAGAVLRYEFLLKVSLALEAFLRRVVRRRAPQVIVRRVHGAQQPKM